MKINFNSPNKVRQFAHSPSRKLLHSITLIILGSMPVILPACRVIAESRLLDTWISWVEPDRIEFFEKFDANKIESIKLFLFVPKDIEKAKQIPQLMKKYHDRYYPGIEIFVNRPMVDSFYTIHNFTLHKNDVLSLSQEIQEYGSKTLELLQKNKKAGYSMTGRSNFSDGKDTTTIIKNSAEYYYLCYLDFNAHSNTFYHSKFYQNEFTINCWDDSEHYIRTELTLPRTVGVQHTYKLISSIITYKNKQIDSINGIRRTEHQPELERYSWYGMK